jgi:hypothetical protein
MWHSVPTSNRATALFAQRPDLDLSVYLIIKRVFCVLPALSLLHIQQYLCAHCLRHSQIFCFASCNDTCRRRAGADRVNWRTAAYYCEALQQQVV